MAGVAVSRSILADILVLIARSWVPARCPKKEIAAGDLWIDRANIRGRRRPSRFSRTQLPWLSGRATERLAILADLKAAGSYERFGGVPGLRRTPPARPGATKTM